MKSLALRIMTENLYVKDAFTNLDDCYEQGQLASSQAFPLHRNPYPAGTSRHEFWESGHQNETDELCGT
jgi:hypothetical protein